MTFVKNQYQTTGFPPEALQDFAERGLLPIMERDASGEPLKADPLTFLRNLEDLR